MIQLWNRLRKSRLIQSETIIPTSGSFAFLVLFLFYAIIPSHVQRAWEFLLSVGAYATEFVYTSKIFENPTLVLLGLTIPIFVLTVTFVGKAARTAKTLSAEIEKSKTAEYEEKIKALRATIDQNSHDPKNLKQQVTELEVLKNQSTRAVKQIEHKYGALGLEHAVLRPSLAFFVSYAFQKIMSSSIATWQNELYLFIALVALIYGISKVVMTLSVVEELLLKTDSDQSKELRDAIVDTFKAIIPNDDNAQKSVTELKKALLEIEEGRKPKPSISFVGDKPIKVAANSEVTVAFDVNLSATGAPEANDVYIFIIVEPAIEILPLPAGTYRLVTQNEDYAIPKGRSAYFGIDKVRRQISCRREFKLKTGAAGTFKLQYRIGCDGYAEEAKKTTIVVS